jgi:hypothetical protein
MENYLPKTMDFYLPKSMDFSLPFTITSKSENCYMLLPVNCVCAILEEYFPLKLKKMGYVLENDIKEFFSK